MKLGSRTLLFLLSYAVVVLGFFAFWAYADAKLKKNARELQNSQISQKFTIVKNREVWTTNNNNESSLNDASLKVVHVQEPEAVKGIYISASTASISKFDKLLDLVDKTELNTIVLDFKDWKGRPAFKLNRESLQEFNASDPVIRDIESIIKKVHDKGIYLIGRVAIFQDPYLAVKKPDWALRDKRGGIWRDWKGVSWVDSTNHNVWEYNVELAREAYERGFDEINFDYVRFPSDGALPQIVYATYDGKSDKSLAMQKFFAYLDHELRRSQNLQTTFIPFFPLHEGENKGGGIPISVDVFGFVMGREDGLGIGQRFTSIAPFFDAVSPMVYPSHYPPRYNGFANSAEHPYEIINEAMKWGVAKSRELAATSTILNSSGKPLGRLRPWLQDFDLGANYDAAMVRKEIQAVYDAGLDDWLLWNASNNYTEDALQRE